MNRVELELRLEQLDKERAIVVKILTMIEDPEYADVLEYMSGQPQQDKPPPLLTIRKLNGASKPRRMDRSQVVLNAMEPGKPVNSIELAETLGEASITIRSAFKVLCDGGRIVRVARGRYERPA
jgi:hypothetical protein